MSRWIIFEAKTAKNGKRKKRVVDSLLVMAEGEGFKPPIPGKGIPDFESSAIDHSANLPIE